MIVRAQHVQGVKLKTPRAWSGWALIGFLVLSLVACETAPPKVPPTELTEFKASRQVTRNWSARINESRVKGFAPHVTDEHVFVADREGNVVAYRRDSGKVEWDRLLDASLGSGVGGDDTHVYVATIDGEVIALRASDGADVWREAVSAEVLVPVTTGFDVVIVRSADGRLVALSGDNGAMLWSASYPPPALSVYGYSKPVLLDSGVLVGLDDGRLVALNRQNGREIWSSTISVPSGRSEVERMVDIDAAILLDESAIYLVNFQGKLTRVEPVRGQSEWSLPLSSTRGLALFEELIVVVDDDSSVYGIDKSSGRELWRQDSLRGRRLTAPTSLSDGVVVGDFEGYLHVLSHTSGELVSRHRLSDAAVRAAPVVRDNTLYAQASDGTLRSLDIE